MSRTIFYGPKDVRAIEVRLYTIVSIDSVREQTVPDEPVQKHRLIRDCIVRKIHKGPFHALHITCIFLSGVTEFVITVWSVFYC